MIKADAPRTDRQRITDPEAVPIFLPDHLRKRVAGMVSGNDFRIKEDSIARFADAIVHFVVLGPQQRFVEGAGRFKYFTAVSAVRNRFDILLLR